MARPTLKFTAAQRRAVAVAAAGGMSHESIAQALQISRNSLEKHFEAELSTVAQRRRMEVLVAQFQAAKRGNVSAQKAFLANEPQAAVPPLPMNPPALAPTPARRGKKEQAQAEAVTAARGTEWDEILPKPGQPLQ